MLHFSFIHCAFHVLVDQAAVCRKLIIMYNAMQLLLYIPGIRDNAPCTSFQALRETPASLLKFVFKILGKLFILEYINEASCINDMNTLEYIRNFPKSPKAGDYLLLATVRIANGVCIRILTWIMRRGNVLASI